MVNANIKTQKEKRGYVENPRIGDRYLINEDRATSSVYYFYKIVSVKGDSIAVNHGNLEYNGFVSEMQSGDFFVEDEEIYFTKKEMLKMLEKGEITSVER